MNDLHNFLLLGAIASLTACSSVPKTFVGPDSGSLGGAGAETGGASANGGTTASRGSGGTTGSIGGATEAGVVGDGGRISAGRAGVEAGTDASPGSSEDGGVRLEHVFVIAMENHDQKQIIGDVVDAPYINDTLVKEYASTSNFVDTLPIAVPSEPHYLLMEAGTNAFGDVTFTSDANPSAANSTSSTEHLVRQMKDAQPTVTWRSYQEGLDSATGACPIASSAFYAPKHDPFVFFQDVSGSPPSKSDAYCAAHHEPASALQQDLRKNQVASYNFITPDLCNDMHGAGGCADSNTIRAGDTWLSANLPPLIAYANEHRGVIFVVWDEGSATSDMPFLAVGPSVKKGVATARYTHGSLVKSVEEIFQLPLLATVANENDFAALFRNGSFP